MMQLCRHLIYNGANAELYKKRATLLESLGRKRKLIYGLTKLDCQFNVTDLIEILFKNEPSMWEYHTCNIDATQSIVPRIFMPINLQEIVKGTYKK